MNPDAKHAATFEVGITIHTKDGSRIGNAIIYDMTDVANRPLFHIETDFGNRCKMFVEELDDWFTPGFHVSYNEWADDREEARRKIMEEVK